MNEICHASLKILHCTTSELLHLYACQCDWLSIKPELFTWKSITMQKEKSINFLTLGDVVMLATLGDGLREVEAIGGLLTTPGSTFKKVFGSRSWPRREGKSNTCL